MINNCIYMHLSSVTLNLSLSFYFFIFFLKFFVLFLLLLLLLIFAFAFVLYHFPGFPSFILDLVFFFPILHGFVNHFLFFACLYLFSFFLFFFSFFFSLFFFNFLLYFLFSYSTVGLLHNFWQKVYIGIIMHLIFIFSFSFSFSDLFVFIHFHFISAFYSLFHLFTFALIIFFFRHLKCIVLI